MAKRKGEKHNLTVQGFRVPIDDETSRFASDENLQIHPCIPQPGRVELRELIPSWKGLVEEVSRNK